MVTTCYFPRESRPVSMVDLNQGVIDLAVSTIKKTQHGVTMATVPQAMRANLEVSRSIISFPLLFVQGVPRKLAKRRKKRDLKGFKCMTASSDV